MATNERKEYHRERLKLRLQEIKSNEKIRSKEIKEKYAFEREKFKKRKKYGFGIKLPKSRPYKLERFKSEDQILLENLERRDRALKARERIRKYWQE